MASSKTFFNPFCVRAEHSRYLFQPSQTYCYTAIFRMNIPDGVDLLLSLDAKRVGDRGHALLTKTLDSLGIIAQIELGANQDDGDVRGVMGDLGVPLNRTH